MKVEFAEMTEYLNNIRKELNTVYSENNRLRMEIDKLREELRLAKAGAGAGPTVGPQVAYPTNIIYSQQPHRSMPPRPRCFGDAVQYNDSPSPWSPCPSCAHRLNCANEIQRVQARCQNYQPPR